MEALNCLEISKPQLLKEKPISRLVSLLDMLQFNGTAFFNLSETLIRLDTIVGRLKPDAKLSEVDRRALQDALNISCQHLENAQLNVSLIALLRLVGAITMNAEAAHISELSRVTHGRITDELLSVKLFQLSGPYAGYYEERHLFGEKVENKFPSLLFDIEEAGKCLALGRATSTVFHLMRVMELSLYEFAKTLGITIDVTEQWQVILDQVNKAIRNLPRNTPEEKIINSNFAEAASHLYAVKVAWRNEVMHPRAVYTEEEAQDIFQNVKTFIQQLAEKVLI